MNPSKTIKFKCWVLLVLLVSVSSQGFSQNLELLVAHPKFELLNANDGISAGYTLGFVQDSTGYLWVGSYAGLNRYDGVNIKNYFHDPNDPHSLPSNVVSPVFCDHKNRIWFVHDNFEVSLFDSNTNQFYPVDYKLDRKSFIDKKGFIWRFINHKWTLSHLDNFELTNDTLKIKVDSIKNLSYNKTRQITYHPFTKIFQNYRIYNSSLIHLSSDSIYLNKIDYQDYKINTIKSLKLPFTCTDKRLLNGNFIIDKKNGKIYVFGEERYIVISLATFEIIHEINYSNNISLVSATLIDRYERIWIYDTNGKLYLLNTSNYTLTELRLIDEPDQNIAKLCGKNIYTDSNQNIYATTNGDGLFKYNIHKDRFKYIGDRYKGPVSKLTQLNDGKIILKLAWQHWHVNSKKNSLDSFYHLNVLSRYGANNRLVQRFDNKVYFREKSDKSEGIYALYEWFPESQILSYRSEYTYKDIWAFDYFFTKGDQDWQGDANKDRNLIIARSNSDRGPINFCDTLDLHFNIIAIKSHHVSNNRVIWIGTDGSGLVKYDTENLQHKNYINHGVINNQVAKKVFAITPDPESPDSILWLGTDLGLTRMNVLTENFKTYTIKDGLPNNVIYGILTDHENNLWLSTNKGLALYKISSNEFICYEEADGLQHNEFNSMAAEKDEEGNLYFAGMGGLSYFDPHDFYNLRNDSKVIINGLKVFNELIEYKAYKENSSPIIELNKPIENTEKITLGYDQRMLTIQFAHLDYSNPQKNQYRYKLKSNSKNWIDLGNKNEVTLANLAPGRYQFNVQAANHNNIWSEDLARLEINVLGPWWQKLWVQLMGLILLITLIGIFFKYRERQNLRLQQLRNQISRDLHDEIGSTLSSIALFSAVAKKTSQNINSTLNNMLDQIDESSTKVVESMNDIVWTINSKNDKLLDVISRMRSYAVEVTEAKNWELEFISPESIKDKSLDMIVRRNVYLIFKEAINNAVKYSEASQLSIKIEFVVNKMILNISDNGIGFNIEGLKDQASLGGNGILNMKTRSHEINAILEINSKLGKGTQITLIAPI